MHLCVVNGHTVTAPIDEQHPQVIVGRHRDCDMVVKSPRISRRHCQVKWTPDGIAIKDLGGSGGTQVGDRKIGRARIKPGDRILLADIELELRDGPAPKGRSAQRQPLLTPPAAPKQSPESGSFTTPAKTEPSKWPRSVQVQTTHPWSKSGL